MKDFPEITLSHYYSEQDVKDLKNTHIRDYQLKINKLEKPKENTGGSIWEGVVIFITASVAAGFFQELGKDIYTELKERLFKLKEKLEDGNIYRFTINMKFENSMVFFELTDLGKEDFLRSIDKVQRLIEEQNDFIENNSGFYNAVYDRELKRWRLERNKTFDI